MTWYLVVKNDHTASVVEAEDKPFPPGWSSVSCGYETRAALVEGEGLGEACTLCEQPYGTKYMNDVKRALQTKRICFNCWFWTEHIKPGGLVIDGRHYEVGPETQRSAAEGREARGMGGRLFRILKANGEFIRTTNLWHQGKVPEHLRDRFPNNAVFLGGAGFVEVGEGCGAFASSEEEVTK